MSRYIVSLDSSSAQQETRAGGKGASLARLRRDGFNVPQGFAVTPAAFKAFLAEFGIQVLTRRIDRVERDLERIRELLQAGHLPHRLAHPVARAYRRLGGRVAVRSSMVGEDTEIASFAGQLDTVLNVEGEGEVLRAVRRCWASTFNPRLINYLAEHEVALLNTALEVCSIAVVVQRMVDAQAAGVAFSADPITGQRCVVIEATRGLGDTLVGGLVIPDRYVVDARGILAETSPAQADAAVLQDDQIQRLATIVRDVARRTSVPQDLEWAWDGIEFWVLQSRPITSLVGKRVYSSRLVSDMSPGLIKPLLYSTNTVSMAKNVLGRIFTELIGPNDYDFARLIKRIHSRLYTDTTLLGELFERIGLPANFFAMIARDEHGERRRPPLNLATVRATFRLLRFVLRHANMADEITAFARRHTRELERYRRADWSTADPEELLSQVDQLASQHRETQWFVFLGPMNMHIRNRLLGRLVKQHASDVAPSSLIRGLVGLKALEPNTALDNIADQARGLGSEALHLLIEQDDETIRAHLVSCEQGRALIRSVDSFLEQHGFLSTNGTDFTGRPWIETPTVIWSAIGRMATQPTAPAADDARAIREDARARVRAQLGWARRILFDRLLASTIAYIDLRERTSLLMSEDAYQMRRIFLALGDQFVDMGILERREDIFYLSYEEIRQLAERTLAANKARQIVTACRAQMEADAQVELPDTICGESAPTRPILLAEGQEYLVGISGSSGVAQGMARVILDPAEAPATLGRDDILVVPFTDVGWTPLFSGIGGIVAETGGQLSHTSIIAREYGLPAVVSVKKATHLIRPGQPVTIDGERGRVYLRHMILS